MVYEEVGMHANILECYDASVENMRLNGRKFGTAIFLGTGGGTPDENDRARQCREWLDAHPEVTASVAIDDCDYDFGAVAIPFVMTDPELGLAMGEARKAADLLNN